MMTDGWYGLTPDDRLLHAGAFNWTFTLGTGLLDPWAIGATALIPAQGVPVEALPLLLRRHDATILAAAPGVFRRLLRSDGEIALPRLRHGLVGGGEAARTAARAMEGVTGTALHEALGMSECSTFLSGAPPAPRPRARWDSPRRAAARRSGRGRYGPLPDDAIGTLAVHRSDPGLMLGYWSEDGTPELPLTGDWFETGDRVSRRPGWRLRLPWPPRRPDHRGRLPRRPAGDRGGVPRRAGGGGLRGPRHQPEARHDHHRAGLCRGRHRDSARGTGAGNGWRATSNHGPSSPSTPCPDPRTENSTGARWPSVVRKALP
jgi:hypothetical protein